MMEEELTLGLKHVRVKTQGICTDFGGETVWKPATWKTEEVGCLTENRTPEVQPVVCHYTDLTLGGIVRRQEIKY